MKLGYSVSATAIRSVLRRAGLPPAGRRAGLTWKQFLAAHANTLVAADFFAVDTVFLKRLYVLFFIHVASRRIVWAACPGEPNGEWVTQQARGAPSTLCGLLDAFLEGVVLTCRVSLVRYTAGCRPAISLALVDSSVWNRQRRR